MANAAWYLALGDRQVGPLTEDDVLRQVESGSVSATTLCWTSGMSGWTPLGEVPAFAERVRPGVGRAGSASPRDANVPPPPSPSRPARRAHEIDYRIVGNEMQFVEIELDPGECAVAEAGTMMYMTDGIGMQTILGDGSQPQAGFLDELLGAGRRLLTGESLFMTVFQHTGRRPKERVAFAAPYAGKILALDLLELGGRLICQKDSFLCAARGVSVGIAFQKRIGVGLFGGEGFIMEKLEGDGLCFVHAGGTVHALDLAAGETLRVDTGCIVALQPQVEFDIQYVGNVKTALFGGEGLFFATLKGPGRVWLQSLPFARLADRIVSASRGARREEGSVLDRAFGLGNLLDGDS